jgi:hypothetical protein
MGKLGKIWENRKQIMEGLKNSIIRDAFVEKVAAERREVCNVCPRKDDEGTTCVMKGTQPCCNLCGCSLSSECPDLRWHAVLTEEEEDKLNSL